MQFYTNPERISDPHSLPDAETFYKEGQDTWGHLGTPGIVYRPQRSLLLVLPARLPARFRSHWPVRYSRPGYCQCAGVDMKPTNYRIWFSKAGASMLEYTDSEAFGLPAAIILAQARRIKAGLHWCVSHTEELPDL